MPIRGKLQRLTAEQRGLRFSSRKWDERKDPHDHLPVNGSTIQPMMLVAERKCWRFLVLAQRASAAVRCVARERKVITSSGESYANFCNAGARYRT